MNAPISLGQFWLAIALPTLFALTSTAVALVGLMLNNSRFNSIDSRFDSIDNRMTRLDTRLDELTKDVGNLAERVAKIEGKIEGRHVVLES